MKREGDNCSLPAAKQPRADTIKLNIGGRRFETSHGGGDVATVYSVPTLPLSGRMPCARRGKRTAPQPAGATLGRQTLAEVPFFEPLVAGRFAHDTDDAGCVFVDRSGDSSL